MTNAELIAKKLALIETYVRELRTLADPTRIEVDLREERFVEHTLQIAIQAALDVASHFASAERLGEPRTNQELFELLNATVGSTRRSRGPCAPRSGFATCSSTAMRPSTSASCVTCWSITSTTA